MFCPKLENKLRAPFIVFISTWRHNTTINQFLFSISSRTLERRNAGVISIASDYIINRQRENVYVFYIDREGAVRLVDLPDFTRFSARAVHVPLSREARIRIPLALFANVARVILRGRTKGNKEECVSFREPAARLREIR